MPLESTSVTCAMTSAASVWSSTVTRSDEPAPVPWTTCAAAVEATAAPSASAITSVLSDGHIRNFQLNS